jgi:2-haloacid dehalogenase
MTVADPVVVFDVNETLLDLSALDPTFEQLFGRTGVRGEWFAQVVQSAMVSVITDVHHDFGTIGRAALSMVAARHGTALSSDDVEAVLDGMRHLPPHDEVPRALARLRAAGLRLATLTNSPPDTAEAQLANAELDDYFEVRMSVETSGRLKPSPTVYRDAARRLGVGAEAVWLVAAHDWDVTGARRAGWSAAFVQRPGKVLDPTGEAPQIVAPDLEAAAIQLLATVRR